MKLKPSCVFRCIVCLFAASSFLPLRLFAQPDGPAKKDVNREHALKAMSPLLQVANLDESIQFYTRQLGFEEAFREDGGFAMLERDSCSLFLAQKQTKVDLRNVTARSKRDGYAAYDVFVYCANGTLDKLFREFRDLAVPMPAAFQKGPVKRDYGIRDFSITDPDGYDIVFGELVEAEKVGGPKLDLDNHTASIQADNSNFAGSKFHNVNFSGTVFDDINLSKAVFNNINLSNAKFTDVNLSGATFTDCDLRGVAFNNCRTDGLTINGVAVDKLLKK